MNGTNRQGRQKRQEQQGGWSSYFKSIVIRLAVLALLAVQPAVAAEGGSRERTFIQAQEAFEHAKTSDEYRHAAEMFESLLQDGYVNGAVYYNAGNAWIKAGEYGRAIANYRKAQPFRPRDPYLQANLAQALSTAPGHLPEPARPWWRQIFFWRELLSIPEKFFAASLLGISAFLLGLAALKGTRSAKGLNRAALAFVFLTLLLGIDAGLTWSEATAHGRAVVVKETQARKGNSTDYQAAFDQPLKDGAEFTVMERRGDWIFGHFEGAGDAWVARDAVVE